MTLTVIPAGAPGLYRAELIFDGRPPSKVSWTVAGDVVPGTTAVAVLDLTVHAGRTVRVGARAKWLNWVQHWTDFAVPARCGVDPAATGPRIPREQLVDHPGGDAFHTPGEVITGRRFLSTTTIRASDVTFVDCLWDVQPDKAVGAQLVRPLKGVAGTVLDHCELDGNGTRENGGGVDMGIGGARWTARWCNIHHVSDGVRLNTGTVLEDSWVHHLSRRGEGHPDCAQITGGTGAIVRRCTLAAANPDTGDRGNAAIQIGGETAHTADLLIEDNLMSGGNYTINQGQGDIDVDTVVIRRNTYGGGARYGFAILWKRSPAPEDNVRVDGTPVPVARWK